MEWRRRKDVVFYSGGSGEELHANLQQCKREGQAIEVWEFPGSRMHSLVEEIDSYLDSYPFDTVYMISGEYNLIHTNEESGFVEFNWDSEQMLGDYYKRILTDIDRSFVAKYPASRVIFCPMVGFELGKVVSEAKDLPEGAQDIVNGTVWIFNQEVRRINNRKNLKTPFLLSPVHRHNNGKKHAYWHHLNAGKDPLRETLGKWAKEIIKATTLNG